MLSKRDLVEELAQIHFVLRPANFTGIGNFGYGMRHLHTPKNQQLNIINVMGMMGFHRVHASNPYQLVNKILDNPKHPSPFTLVAFSAIASAEKQTMAHMMAGKCSAIIGYGAKAITLDAQIIDETAYITDVGRISAPFSVAGFTPESEIERYTTQRPRKSEELISDEIELQAVVITLDDETGKATHLQPLRATYPLNVKAPANTSAESTTP